MEYLEQGRQGWPLLAGDNVPISEKKQLKDTLAVCFISPLLTALMSLIPNLYFS